MSTAKTAPQLVATYRLQLGPGLDFAKTRTLVPYLRSLGVSHLYLSPSLQARPGSTHGYDVTDPTKISDALGGERQLRALADSGLSVILDIVPNHMGIGEENRFWSDPQLRERFFDLYPGGGYRRFFDIDDMAAIRQEREDVFAATHEKVLQLLREGVIDGLRVDHPDGLADPAGYLRRLRQNGAQRVWVEKILSRAHPPEPLREWPVSGTVGYEFLNDACALFVDPAGREPLTALLAEATGESRPFAEIALQAQLQQAHGPFARDLERLARLGPFDAQTLAQGLAKLPVYRTYVEPWSGRVAQADRDAIAAAGMDEQLARTLSLECQDGSERESGDRAELVTRFQQLSPAIIAKGVEDTAFYRYLRLLCLNEVGGDPDRFGIAVEDFHAANLERAERFPEGLLTTQTHDTKRSGDARARLGAISGMTERWRGHVLRWMQIGERLHEGGQAPDLAEQYLIHQTVISVWPIDRERLDAYLVKALRERKLATSWTAIDQAWEKAVLRFTHRLLDSPEFQRDFEPFVQAVAKAGERSALGQLLLKLTCPGVPDIYQGDELWRLSLVDPDNRRPVDWERRRRMLDAVERGGPLHPQARKLHVIRQALALRRRRPHAFQGAYVPIPAGPGTCAFQREDEVLVVVQVRPGAGGELHGPLHGRWRDVLSGAEHRLQRVRAVRALTDEDGLALLERVDVS